MVVVTQDVTRPETYVAVSVLEAVADPVRWSVLAHLSSTPCCVCEIQREVTIAPSLLSYHLKVLREAATSTRGRHVVEQRHGCQLLTIVGRARTRRSCASSASA